MDTRCLHVCVGNPQVAFRAQLDITEVATAETADGCEVGSARCRVERLHGRVLVTRQIDNVAKISVHDDKVEKLALCDCRRNH